MNKHSLALLTVMLFSALPARAQYTVKVDPTENRGTWQGWGASLAWWANAVGGKNYENTYADLFFTRKTVPYLDQNLPGLGFNIARYNVGGYGRGGAVADVREQVSPSMPWFKAIDGYWLDWNDKNPNSQSWDWSRDNAQRSMLRAAIARGADQIELFSNAPMWWMNTSKSSAGGNLQAWNEGDFAVYLATVAAHARDSWKIPVTSIEPFNEPSAGWWNYPKEQEGANISREAQTNVVRQLRRELDARSLQNIAIAASDENTIDAATATYTYFQKHEVATLVDRVNVHSYSGLEPYRDNKKRAQLRQVVGDKPLWMSEFGDNDGGGMKLAQTIFEDINFARPTAWIYWQPLEPSSAWGLVNADYGANATDRESGQPKWVYTKYYVMAQLTRFLRPGFAVIGSDDHNSIVSYDKTRRQLNIITLNYGNAQPIIYDLSNLKTVGLSGQITATTQVSAKGEVRGPNANFQIAPIFVHDKRLKVQALPDSIYSIVVNGVEL